MCYFISAFNKKFLYFQTTEKRIDDQFDVIFIDHNATTIDNSSQIIFDIIDHKVS